jgi:hypothetical protein
MDEALPTRGLDQSARTVNAMVDSITMAAFSPYVQELRKTRSLHFHELSGWTGASRSSTGPIGTMPLGLSQGWLPK